MADTNDPTQNVAIWDDTKGKNVSVITDGSVERLAVDASVSTSVIPTGDPIHAYDDSTPGSHPTTLATHTVNTGKVFHIFGWSMNSEGGTFDVELQIAGTAVDGMRQDNSAFTSLGANQRLLNPIPIAATAAQVVRIQTVSGDNSKNFLSMIWGIEVDA